MMRVTVDILSKTVWPIEFRGQNKVKDDGLNYGLGCDEQWGDNWPLFPIGRIFHFINKHPSWISQPNCSGQLPLHHALYFKHVTIRTLQFLLDSYPQALRIPDNNGHLPLHLAVTNGCAYEVCEFLIHADPLAARVPDNEGNLPLHLISLYCFQNGRLLQCLKLIYDTYPDAITSTNEDGQIPLHVAYRNRFVTQFLLSRFPEGAWETDAKGRLPLHVALEASIESNVIQQLYKEYPPSFLLRDGSRMLPIQLAINASMFSLHSFAALRQMIWDNPGCLIQLVCNGQLPIHYACSIGAPCEVILFLAHSNPSTLLEYNHEGYTPLHLWCMNVITNQRKTSIAELKYVLKICPDAALAPVLNDNDNECLLPVMLAGNSNAALDVILILTKHSLNEILLS